MLLGKSYRDFILNVKNIPGPSLRKKIVVIECDDWGGIRTPSKDIYNKLLDAGLSVDKCRFRFDTLENLRDLELLFSILESVKDRKGNNAIMTPLVNVANPDFDRIKQHNFSEYFYEKFSDTLIRYGRGEDVLKLWKLGIKKGIFVPELHGREHITVQIWLQKLREGHKDLLFAFDNGYISLNVNYVNPAANGFRAEFYFDSESQVSFLQNSIKDGVNEFSEIFGFPPKIFVPSNSIFHPVFESGLAEAGIKYLNVGHINKIPGKNGNLKFKFYRNGKRTSTGLTYYVRNCAFEPSDSNYKGIDQVMQQINVAFRWNKPAIISTHRVNFVGEIDTANRDNGLKELQKLLVAILKKWPDIEFMSSSDMFKEIEKTSNFK